MGHGGGGCTDWHCCLEKQNEKKTKEMTVQECLLVHEHFYNFTFWSILKVNMKNFCFDELQQKDVLRMQQKDVAFSSEQLFL